MTRKKIATLGLLIVLATSAFSQLAEKANFFGGITYQFVGFTPLNSPKPYLYPFYGFALGMDYVLLHSNDVVSLGINPNAHLCLQFNGGLNFYASVPTYMLARFGAGATPFNEQKFGIGAGIGGSASYFLTTGGNYGSLSTLFFNPGACVELNMRTRGSSYLFRFNWSLMRPAREVSYGGQSTTYRVGVLGLGILYSF